MSHRLGDVPPGDREMTAQDLADWRANEERRKAKRAEHPGEVEVITILGPTTIHIGPHSVLISTAPEGACFEFLPRQGSALDIRGDGAGLIVTIKETA